MRFQIAFGVLSAGLLAASVLSWTASEFHQEKADNGSTVCGMSPPNKTLNNVELMVQCVASCSDECQSPCQAVNYWKTTKLCEHFYYKPCSYDVQQDCVNYQVMIDGFLSAKNDILGLLRATAYMLSAHMLSQFVRLSVRLSVRPSHGWISQKRLKIGSCNFHHTVAPSV